MKMTKTVKIVRHDPDCTRVFLSNNPNKAVRMSMASRFDLKRKRRSGLKIDGRSFKLKIEQDEIKSIV